MDRISGRGLSNAIEVHTVELTKYNSMEESISQASKLERWAFLRIRAQDYDADRLLRLLPGLEFETAINTIEAIAAKAEEKQMYDQREKAQRDYEWALSGAREERREQGLEMGLEQGLATGVLIGKIQLLQELLCGVPSSKESLAALTPDQRAATLARLQERLRDRPI